MKGQKLWELIQSSKHLSVFSEKFWYDDPQITIEISQWRTMVLGSNFEKLAIMAEKNPYLFSLVRAFDLDYDLPEFHGSTNG